MRMCFPPRRTNNHAIQTFLMVLVSWRHLQAMWCNYHHYEFVYESLRVKTITFQNELVSESLRVKTITFQN